MTKKKAVVKEPEPCELCGLMPAEHPQCELCHIGVGTGHMYGHLVPLTVKECVGNQVEATQTYQVDEGCYQFYAAQGFLRLQQSPPGEYCKDGTAIPLSYHAQKRLEEFLRLVRRARRRDDREMSLAGSCSGSAHAPSWWLSK